MVPTWEKELKKSLEPRVVFQTFNLSIQKAESSRSLSFRAAWYTEQVPECQALAVKEIIKNKADEMLLKDLWVQGQFKEQVPGQPRLDIEGSHGKQKAGEVIELVSHFPTPANHKAWQI